MHEELQAGLKERIRQLVDEAVSVDKHAEWFREPLIGYADANDPLYNELDQIIGSRQLRPQEMLPGAKTVVVVFLPYGNVIVEDVRHSWLTSGIFSHAYMYVNTILDRSCQFIIKELKERGFAGTADPPTENFDYATKTAKWAHKSSAVIAGMGTFGLNHLLITEKGCMGRLTSVVTDAKLEPTPRTGHEYCLYYQNGGCKACVRNCPSGAICSDGTIDKWRCDSYLEGKNTSDWEQGCPRCQAGPCAMKGF